MKTKFQSVLRVAVPVVLATASIALLSAKKSTGLSLNRPHQEKFFREWAHGPVALDTVPDGKKDKDDIREINLEDMNISELNKVQLQMEKAQAELKANLSRDWKKEEKLLKEKLSKENLQQAKKELELAMLHLDNDKLQKELKAEMDKAKKEMEKAQLEMELNKVDFSSAQKEMEKATIEMKKAQEEMNNLTSMLKEMKKDGLIDEKGDYEIEWKKELLYINGKQQSKEVSDKYRKYLKDEPVRIKHKKRSPVNI